MADLAVELGDAALRRACETLWRDVMDTKMYITAGLGPSAHNEGFTFDYDLPNQTAYAETCASSPDARTWNSGALMPGSTGF